MAKYIISKTDLDQFGQFFGSIDNDTITVENYQDTISYTILGLSGQDSIIGANGKDILFGMEGNDTILGRDNNDILYGNEGNDSLYGEYGYDTIYGGQGNDIIKDSGYSFDGNNGISFLFGNLGDDSITVSSSGNADLFGGQGKDILTGNEGSNSISGDRDQDILRGDLYETGGADTFIISKTADLNEIPTGTENADLILDFINSEDKIGLVGVTFEQLLISEIQPQQIDSIFGQGSVEENFGTNITKFLKIESSGELLAVLGRDRDNFTLTANDFVII
ncbi:MULTISPECIES: calcium-binding protein [Planktothrix]|uniref:calcium-binding protein n=1 Tax=Planktothrix TaxID=54304 RepID=UPI00042A3FF3|nr:MULTISPECIES: calcium-binding protein [Planktothrix]CAD5932830.1 RTX-III toxin determinant A from serotype 8 [Planktothrix agardhii]